MLIISSQNVKQFVSLILFAHVFLIFWKFFKEISEFFLPCLSRCQRNVREKKNLCNDSRCRKHCKKFNRNFWEDSFCVIFFYVALHCHCKFLVIFFPLQRKHNNFNDTVSGRDLLSFILHIACSLARSCGVAYLCPTSHHHDTGNVPSLMEIKYSQ